MFSQENFEKLLEADSPLKVFSFFYNGEPCDLSRAASCVKQENDKTCLIYEAVPGVIRVTLELIRRHDFPVIEYTPYFENISDSDSGILSEISVLDFESDYTDYFGEAHTGSYSFGAEEYVKTMHLVGGTTVTAVRGLLTYGAYAQKYFKTTGTANITDELATEMLIRNGYEPLDISGFSTTMLKEKTVGTGDDFDGISIRGGQPDLAAAISMKVQFNASGLTSAADIANYTYKLHVTVGDQTIEKELNTPEWDNARKRLVFYVYDIPAMFFDNLYSITVTKTATGETYTGSTSITAFIGEAYAAYSNDVPLQQLLAAMYYYNDAANTHFGN